MGQKSSKKTDRYVTGDVTHCNLPDQDVTRYVGRAREYTAVDVIIKKTEDIEPTPGEEAKQRSPVRHPPNSVLRLLTGAHRKSYLLAFVVPKVKGSKPSQLGRNSILFEEAEDSSEDNTKCGVMTHTVFLLRPKVKSRLKKEFSLKKMEAQKTFLNVMMDIEHHSVFSIKDINCDLTPTSIGDCVNKLQEKIDEESAKCGRLLSVMRVEEDETTKNGTSENGVSEKPSNLTLRMIYLHETGDNLKPRYNYKVECVHIKCTEKKLKLKKKAKSTQSKRDTNVTWSEDWLTLVKEDSRLTEVISVGEIALKDASGKENKKPKLREFDVTTLCFYENVVPDEKGAAGDKNTSDDAADEVVGKPMKYDGMVREVWAPIDDNVQNNLEAEAEKYGGAGWELCTVLVTSQVRMKPDGSEFRKCAIFFQRPKEEFVSEIEKGKSKENLLMDGTTKIEVASGESEPQFLEVSPPTSPKEKVERFGIAMLPVIDIGQTKLRATKPSPKLEKSENEPNQLTSGIAAVQLKKVNRDALKKNSPDINRKGESEVNQVKLRRAEVGNSEKKEESKEVPWMKTLEKKREAVMKTNGSKLNENRPKSNEPDGELAKKLDEIKEKRAERMKRVSVHKEEEAKRKSLQETKDENPDNLKEVLDVSSVAVNTVANPDVEIESKDDILPPPPSPINEVIPSPDIELPPPVDDNLISTGSTDVPEEDILPPPPSDVISPSSGDVVAPLNEDVIPPPAENLIVHDISNNENVNEPKSDNVILQSIDDVIPPPNDDAILPPSDDVISPPSDDVVSPPTVDVVLLPSVDAIPPPCDDVIPSLSCDDVIPPPPCDDMIPPPCDDMIPPPNDDIILPPNDDVIPPSPCDDMIPPPNDDIISPPNDDVIPPPKDDVISPPNDDVISPPNIDVIPPTIDDVILSTNDDTISPPNDDVILPPNDDVIPPTNDDVILPPNDDVIPPANDDVIPPANDDVIPPPNDDVISAPKDDVILPPNDDVISPPKDDVISTTNNDVILPPIDDVILSTNDDIIPPTISLGENASSADGKNSSKNRGDVSPLSVLNIPPPPPNNDDIEVDQNNQDNKEKLSSPENSVNIDDVLASFDFVYQDISGNSPNTFEGDHSNQQHASHTEDNESANSEINETVSSVDILDEITKQIDNDPAFSNGTPPNDGKEHLDLNSNHNNNVVNESKAQYTHNST